MARVSTADAASAGAAEEQSIAAWVEANVGGVVRHVARQPRWRPVWFADVERGDSLLELCVRGERVDSPGVWPLRHEMTAQALMERAGIRVAHVYGWCDEPRAFVMDRVPGQPDFRGIGDDGRDRVMDDYMAILAELHQIDIEPFVNEGVTRAARPDGSGRIGMACYERAYRSTKRRPDPFLEFCLGWLARHPIDSKGREAVVVWDSGQFHHDGARVNAILDLELAHIGDPMMDLAGFRQRDSILGYGDMKRLYERYAEYRGEPVDVDAIQLHHFAFTLSNQLVFHSALAAPAPESDYMTNLQWCCETNLFAVEALAEILGVELEPVAMPEARVSPSSIGFGHLVHQLRSIETADEFEQYRLRGAFRLARHLQRVDDIGDACVTADLDDVHALLGHRPDSWQDGDAELEAFVLADEGAHDDELLALFHRRLWRAHQMLGPPGSAMTRHNAVQPFAP
jgi:aminoglycoside phosphotransferase (APT) family kinase protein